MNPDHPTRPGPAPARFVVLVLLVCLVVYWPRLGATGFSSTEGHRVIPGWTMLDQGGWFTPRMFGQVYNRKPPGMPWAVAASAAVLGKSEFSARAVSALASTASALIALAFGCRWFGRRAGLASGLAVALTPLFWSPGRSAEIEALNNFATLASVLLLVDVAVPPPSRTRRGALGMASLAGLAMTLAALAKGPAGFAAIGCALTIIAIRTVRVSRGSLRSIPGEAEAYPTTRRPVWLALLIAGVCIGTLAALRARATYFSGQDPIAQSIADFLWSPAKLSLAGVARVAAMPFLALASALPATLALLFPWGADARREAAPPANARALSLTRILVETTASSLVLLALLGIDNPRYAMPSLTLIPICTGYIARGWEGQFGPIRRRIAAWFALGHPAAWPVLLLLSAGAFIAVVEPRQRATSGRDAGIALAASFPDHAQVWADHMIEARPELLLYAQREAAARGRSVSVVWVPGLSAIDPLPLPRPPGFLLLRTDAESGEAAAYQRAGFMDRLRPITSGKVHKFEYTLYQMTPPPYHAPDAAPVSEPAR